MIVSFLLVFFLSGCALIKTAPSPQPGLENPKKFSHVKSPLKIPTVKRSTLRGTRNQVFWRLAGLGQVTLFVRGMENRPKTVVLQLNDDIFFHPLASGEWYIQGFQINGVKYEATTSSQKAIFKVFKNSYSYAGALVIHCPKIGQEHFDELKPMKFFNRYIFASKKGLCEMVVGNDFDLIKEAWKSPKNGKGSKLTLGL